MDEQTINVYANEETGFCFNIASFVVRLNDLELQQIFRSGQCKHTKMFRNLTVTDGV
jgi:hypothetical protein